MIFLTKIPEVNEDEKSKPTLSDYAKLAKNPLMTLFAIGIFVYVGIEVGIATWISTFLVEKHHFSKTSAAQVVGLFWGFQAIGRFVGGIVLNYLNTSKALIVYSFACLLTLMTATITPFGGYSATCFVAVGFFTSIMFPSIFALAVNSFDKHEEGAVAGVICTAIVGGAVIAPFIGYLSQKMHSLGGSLTTISMFAFGYIAFVGFLTMPRVKRLVSKIKNKSVQS
jgi:MFS transporter, FHS family, L-fucose permease